MSFVFASEQDIRTVGVLIRRERMYGDITITPPIVQDPGPESTGSGGGGSGGGGSAGDLETITVGPYLVDVEIECIVGSGGQPQIVLTKTWEITYITGTSLSRTTEPYTPPEE